MGEEEKKKLGQELVDSISERLRVRPSIELVPPASIPRESGKTALIEIKGDEKHRQSG